MREEGDPRGRDSDELQEHRFGRCRGTDDGFDVTAHRRASCIGSGMLWLGIFQHHSMRSGGRMPTLASVVHCEGESMLLAMPAANTPETHSEAMVALADWKCMWTV
jgi:hypothetical protein